MKKIFPNLFRIFMVVVILGGSVLWLDYESKKGTKETSVLGNVIKSYQSLTKAKKATTTAKKKKKKAATNQNATAAANTNVAPANPTGGNAKKTAKKKAKSTTNTTAQQDTNAPKNTGGYVDDSIKEKARQEALNAAREIYDESQKAATK